MLRQEISPTEKECAVIIIQHCFIIGYNLENAVLLHADETGKSQHLAQRENNGNGKDFVMNVGSNIITSAHRVQSKDHKSVLRVLTVT